MEYRIETPDSTRILLKAQFTAADMRKKADEVYEEHKGEYSAPGFRKGETPRSVIEQTHGKDLFTGPALRLLMQEAVEAAVRDGKIPIAEIMGSPEASVDSYVAGSAASVTVTYKKKPQPELVRYKGIPVKAADTSVSDEELEAAVAKQMAMQADYVAVDRQAREGDAVNIDYAGFCEGEQFEGGTSEGYDLLLGSGSFIPGFEAQLVGAKAGDEVDVNVTFPDPYHSEKLAGKDAVFHVKVNSVQEEIVPELTDEFIREYSYYGSVAEFREAARKQLEATKERSARSGYLAQAFDAIATESKITAPEEMIPEQTRMLCAEYEQILRQSGMTLEQYLSMAGSTREDFEKTLEPEARRRAVNELILDAVIRAEGIEVTQEDREKYIKDAADRYGVSPEEISMNLEGADAGFLYDILKNKAADLIAAEVIPGE